MPSIAITPEALRALRKQYGWSQHDLAEELFVHWGTINRYENGHTSPRGPRLRYLQRLISGQAKPKRVKPKGEK